MNKYIKFLLNSQYRFEVWDRRGFLRNLSDEKYLKKAYKAKFGKSLDLDNPQTFNEKLQWLKLYDRKPIYTTMVDKYEVKKYVADKIGEEYIIPTLGVWERFEDIDFDSLPDQFVLKCTHDSGGLVICRDKSKVDIDSAKVKIEACLSRNYYLSGREWPYKNVKPRIIAEQYMDGAVLKSKEKVENDCVSYIDLQQKEGLLDYKFMCFNGVVKALFLDIGVVGTAEGHATEYYRNVYDRNGTLMPVLETRENYPIRITLPENLSEMVRIAEILSADIPHLRVDLYCLNNGKIKVGELTFFHGSGMSNVFKPKEWDYTFGSWITLPQKS